MNRLQFHWEHDHWHVEQMKAAQHGESSLAMELAYIPVVVLEDELAGKENAVGEVVPDRLGEVRQLRHRIGAKPNVSF
jgi:hypothetical protein